MSWRRGFRFAVIGAGDGGRIHYAELPARVPNSWPTARTYCGAELTHVHSVPTFRRMPRFCRRCHRHYMDGTRA